MKKLLITIAMFTVFTTNSFAETPTLEEYKEKYLDKICTTSCAFNECHTSCHY